jgi:hypothetical protein
VKIIDTGTAPEFYADDLGEIRIQNQNVCWVAVRDVAPDERLAVVKVVTPLGAVPSIAAQIVSSFALMIGRTMANKLRQLAGMPALH